ncbi:MULTISPECIES: substrate-binding periplasmic protein [unclassified Maridesulfovibrio]|uniref:substrate-binding periplasmic protein n=1 Tax=unclassified Maridesulfovibrio TaxID=2794999 RepID=UPI003B434928
MITAFRIFVLALFLSLVSVKADASKLKLMAEEYPPFSYKQEGKPKGLFIDLVNKIQEKLDAESSEVTFYPWARGYKMLQVGEGDALFPMCMTAERSGMFKFVGPIFWDDVYFYTTKESGVDLKELGDAKKVGKIAVTRDDVFHQNLVSMGYTNLDVSSSQKCDFLKLLKGRADLVPMGRKAISYFFDRNPELDLSLLERVGPPIFFTSSYIAFKNDTSDEVVSKWQAAFDELKMEGEWLKILDKYFPPDLVN